MTYLITPRTHRTYHSTDTVGMIVWAESGRKELTDLHIILNAFWPVKDV